MAQEPKEWEFRSKPAWQRLIIMLGGVVINVIVGFFIYIMLVYTQGTYYSPATEYKYGMGFDKALTDIGFEQGDRPILIDGDSLDRAARMNHFLLLRDVETVTVLRNGKQVDINIPEDIGDKMFKSGASPVLQGRYPFKIEEVTEGGYADDLGMEAGGKVVSIAGRPVKYQTDVTYIINNFLEDDEEFVLEYERNGQIKEFKFLNDEAFKEDGFGIMMLSTDNDIVNETKRDLSFSESISVGISQGYWTMHDYLAQMKYVFSAEGATQVGGFGTIAKLYPDSFDWIKFWGTTAWISFVLAIMNILPIPALDGGHVMFLLYEIITGRQPNEKFLERAQIVGFVLLVALLLWANGLDVFRAIFD
jgi:regulator of sigma E protease